ncbi:efflux RND transporter permease subunit [Paracoccus liaowanqingii]|uniref:Efflux RND transporter permease subunit n=1 Tax=Paracoccus liaowanqingii TaxID=2560053 RepID=A0A4Z1CH39_9RHOB|nr:efflux RND transporter permease subunit [Paracoccus liaowanqingii]TGN60114.1 efflux RND transporter permease subunit [Paracoccus liaowanqingii]
MTLSELCLRRPVLAIVANLLILVGGTAAVLSLPVRELPDVDTANVTINVPYEGAAPEVVDAEIATVIEGAVSGISGIRTISSDSARGNSRTVIEFETGVDIDVAANDVRAEVARISGDLPLQAEDPTVAKSDDQGDPVIRLSLTSERQSASDLTDFADRYLVDRIATINGVADVTIEGEQAYAMRIWLDRRALAARNITTSEVIEALERNNIELPAGALETTSRQFQVRTDTRLSEPAEFESISVGGTADFPVTLGEVARVERGVEDDSSILRADFQSAVGLSVLRQSQSNTVEISAEVEALLPDLRASLPPGTQLTVASDDAVFIRASIREVLVTLGITTALVVAVIALFLGSLRATLVPAVTIPVAVVGACAGLALFGFSINILTLFALILAIGLVVDDAIVVLENVQRRVENGEDPLAAAANGSRQVTFAVIATTAVLVSVFVPISLLEGEAGRLFTEFGITLAVAVIVSSFVALSLASRLLRKDQTPGWFGRLVDRVFAAVETGFRKLLGLVLALPWLVLGLVAFLGALSWPLFDRLPSELTPEEDRGIFFINVDGPIGVNLSYTDAVVTEVETILQPLIEDGSATGITSIVGRYGDLNRAFVIVRLAEWGDRDESQFEVIDRIEPRLQQISAADIRVDSPAGLGLRGAGSPLQIQVGGPNRADVIEWATLMQRAMEGNDRLVNLQNAYEPNQPGYRVTVDRDRVRDLGLDAADVSEALQVLFASAEVSEFTEDGRQYPVIVQAEDADRVSPQDIQASFIRTDSGQLVPLAGLVTIEDDAGPPALYRFDRLPSVELSAGLADGYDLGSAIAFVEEAAAEELPVEATMTLDGQARELQDSSGALIFAFGLAVLIVFLVLAAQFESFVHPLIIILPIPLGVTGALGTLFLTGQSLNIYSQVGMVLLIGLMAKNGILIVEFANQLRDEGKDVREAAIEGATSRLRAIMMTVASTLLGAVPLVLATGAGAESRVAIGLVILGGLAFSSVLIVVVIPLLHTLLAPLTSRKGQASEAVDKALAGEGTA